MCQDTQNAVLKRPCNIRSNGASPVETERPPRAHDDREFSQTLDTIRAFIALNGYPPTVRELCRNTGVASTSAMSYRLHRLEQLGRIRIVRHIARGIIVLDHTVLDDEEKT